MVESAPDLKTRWKSFKSSGPRPTPFGQKTGKHRPKLAGYHQGNCAVEYRKGLALTADELMNAELKRSALYSRVAKYFEHYDALIIPAAQVPPFDANLDWVSEINGVAMPTYIDWMAVCCMIQRQDFQVFLCPEALRAKACPLGCSLSANPEATWPCCASPQHLNRRQPMASASQT